MYSEKFLSARQRLADVPYDRLKNGGMFSAYEDFYTEYLLLAANAADGKVNLVELGSDIGVSARMFNIILRDFERKFIFVDLVLKREMECLLDNEVNSFIIGSAEDAVSEFEDSSLDILHMDTSPHSYTQTRDLFNLYKNKVKDSGVILVHDASPITYGSAKFLCELQHPYYVTFCDERPPLPDTAPAVILIRR